MFLVVVSSIFAVLVTGLQRENLAVRHPCYAINKRLDKHITWTEKLASSQYKGKLIEWTFADEWAREREKCASAQRSMKSHENKLSHLVCVGVAVTTNVPVSHSS